MNNIKNQGGLQMGLNGSKSLENSMKKNRDAVPRPTSIVYYCIFFSVTDPYFGDYAHILYNPFFLQRTSIIKRWLPSCKNTEGVQVLHLFHFADHFVISKCLLY